MGKRLLYHIDGEPHTVEVKYSGWGLPAFDIMPCSECGHDAEWLTAIDENDHDDFIRCLDPNCNKWEATE